MLGRRTDLALEAKEIWEEGAAEAAVLTPRRGAFWTGGGRRPWASRRGGM